MGRKWFGRVKFLDSIFSRCSTISEAIEYGCSSLMHIRRFFAPTPKVALVEERGDGIGGRR
jgi:hypothetical protein